MKSNKIKKQNFRKTEINKSGKKKATDQMKFFLSYFLTTSSGGGGAGIRENPS
jgi:hypothetical protein